MRPARGHSGFLSPTLGWAPAPSPLVTGGASGYQSRQPAQQAPSPAEIAPSPMEARVLQGDHLGWPPRISCAKSVAKPSTWGWGPDCSTQHRTPSTGVRLWLGPEKGASLSCAWGGAGPALTPISPCQTGSPRSSNWPQSWSSTWARSLSSAAWPLATRCQPATAWSCARLMAPCSRYHRSPGARSPLPCALAPPPSPRISPHLHCRLPQKHPFPHPSAGQHQASAGSQGAELRGLTAPCVPTAHQSHHRARADHLRVSGAAPDEGRHRALGVPGLHDWGPGQPESQGQHPR